MICGTTPFQLATGVKVYAPSVPITIAPTSGIVAAVVPAVNTTGLLLPSTTPAIVKVVTLNGPSTLVPSITLPVFAVSSGVVVVSLASVKSSLTGVTVISRVEVSFAPEPSVNV